MKESYSPKPIIAAAYMRVSTAKQEEEQTIDDQWLEISERIQRDNASISEEHIYKDNGYTGSLLARPALDKLRTDAKDGLFNQLYIYDRSRLSRNFLHQEIVLDELRQLGITIIELHGVSGTTPEEVVVGSVLGVFAQYEREKIKERMRLGKMRVIQENKELLGYNPCYGYDLHRTIKGAGGRRAYFTINKEEAKVVKYMFEMAAKGFSIYKIRLTLKEEGIKPPKSKSGVWGNTTVSRILKNTTYIGEHYYNKSEAVEAKNSRTNQKYRKVAKTSRKEKPKSEWWQVEVPAIIDKKLFNQVQEQLKKNKKYSKRHNTKNEYLLAGLVRCECGRMRTGDPAPNHHCYYRCINRWEKMERVCMSGGVCVPILDDKVWDTVCRLLTQPTMIKKYADKLSSNDKHYKEEIEKLDRKLKKLEEENSRYIDIFGKGLITEQKLRELTDGLRDKKMSLETKKIEFKRVLNTRPSISPLKIAENMVKLLEEKLSFEQKQSIIRAVIEKVEATPEEATIFGRIPVFEGIDNSLISINESKNNEEISESSDEKCGLLKNFTLGHVGYEITDRYCWFSKCREKHAF